MAENQEAVVRSHPSPLGDVVQRKDTRLRTSECGFNSLRPHRKCGRADRPPFPKRADAGATPAASIRLAPRESLRVSRGGSLMAEPTPNRSMSESKGPIRWYDPLTRRANSGCVRDRRIELAVTQPPFGAQQVRLLPHPCRVPVVERQGRAPPGAGNARTRVRIPPGAPIQHFRSRGRTAKAPAFQAGLCGFKSRRGLSSSTRLWLRG